MQNYNHNINKKGVPAQSKGTYIGTRLRMKLNDNVIGWVVLTGAALPINTPLK